MNKSQNIITPNLKRIRILHIVLSLEIGGMETVIRDLIISADLKRFKPMVLCLVSLGPLAEELRSKGICVFLASPMKSLKSWFYPKPIVKCIKEYSADVVHVHTGCWFKGVWAAKLCNIRNIVITEHGRYLPEYFVRKYSDIIAGYMSNHIVAVSQDIRDYLNNKLLINNKKMSVIINGVNFDSFVESRVVQPESGIRVGIIARLEPVKDHETLLKAMNLIAVHSKDVHLKIVGDGSQRKSLEKIAKELHISDNVHFLGFRRDIADVLKEIDVFVLCSLSEGTPVSLLEAMAAGKPVVSTAVGEIPRIVVEGKGGFLVPPKSPELLADAIIQLNCDLHLRERMASYNQSLVKDCFGVQAMTSAYELFYVDK